MWKSPSQFHGSPMILFCTFAHVCTSSDAVFFKTLNGILALYFLITCCSGTWTFMLFHPDVTCQKPLCPFLPSLRNQQLQHVII